MLVLYATLLAPVIPDAAGQLIIASVLSALAAILISQIMVPETEERHTDASLIEPEPVAVSTMDAVVKGTTVGLQLLLNIVAMLIVLVALVHLVNAALGLLPPLGGEPVTLQRMLGYAMAPICWLMGLPWREALKMPAAEQMRHLAAFFGSIDFWKLRPAPEMLAKQPGTESAGRFVSVARSEEGEFAVAYVPQDRAVEVVLKQLPPRPQITWVNPRDGTRSPAVGVVTESALQLPTPAAGDWLLLIRSGN